VTSTGYVRAEVGRALPGPGCEVNQPGGGRCWRPGAMYLIGCVHEHVAGPHELCAGHSEGKWQCMECEEAGHACPAIVSPAPAV
jgi:hypothetical protein